MTETSFLKPFIIPVFIPHKGCPHQCIFCNQTAITGVNKDSLDLKPLRTRIDTYLTYKSDHRGMVQISYYGGTFLGLERQEILTYLTLARDYVDMGRVHSIRCSTRPDTITQYTLDLVRPFPLKTIELGVQSMDNEVLFLSHRGHTAEDTENAVSLLRDKGYEIGLQMMVGLPGDSQEKSYETALRMAAMKPDFVRIYPTVVLEKSPLAILHKKVEYQPLSLAESVEQVKALYLLFKEKGIPVIRMGLQAEEGLELGKGILDGPYHPSFGQMIYSGIFLDKARVILEQEYLRMASSVTFLVHPKNISKFRGLKNCNLHVLKAEFGIVEILVSGDHSLGPDTVITAKTVA
ncbi:MAG: radical SAM protein [Proteobacteria bacterium]|nr:radical SAM protein [Pseudomonadota bacterium]